MGKATGFIEYSRKTAGYRDVSDRVKDYLEVALMPDTANLADQGARCMDCGVPYCHALGCPLYNLIPEWNDAVYKGNWAEALQRLELTNNFPEITGRICPAPCETSCTLSINSAPVTIRQIELAISEKSFELGLIVPRPPKVETGKRVAIIGSGPAGLAAAQQLRRMGHSVTVFERSPSIGGILRYGIPDFKLEKKILDRRIAQMQAEGVEFETNTTVGEDISARFLQQKFAAILLSMGAGEPRDLHVPGRGLEGIHFAMEYLTLSNRVLNGEISADKIISAHGKTVLVIGGGDTGADCVGTANRQGAAKVYQFEVMPKPQDWKEANNPNWPNWPQILRTSSSHEEGCVRDWAITTKSFSGSDVRVQQVNCARVDWKKPENGGAPVMTEVEGSAFSIKVDLVLLAMGFLHVKHEKVMTDLDIAFDSRGNIKTTNYATTTKGVFAAGDAGTGASLVVRAIYHGREAAVAMDEFLQG